MLLSGTGKRFAKRVFQYQPGRQFALFPILLQELDERDALRRLGEDGPALVPERLLRQTSVAPTSNATAAAARHSVKHQRSQFNALAR